MYAIKTRVFEAIERSEGAPEDEGIFRLRDRAEALQSSCFQIVRGNNTKHRNGNNAQNLIVNYALSLA